MPRFHPRARNLNTSLHTCILGTSLPTCLEGWPALLLDPRGLASFNPGSLMGLVLAADPTACPEPAAAGCHAALLSFGFCGLSHKQEVGTVISAGNEECTHQ